MQQLTGQVKGNLTIGASRTVGEYIMPYVVSEFKKEYPDVDIALEIYNTKKVEKNIMNNTIDVGLVESDISNKKLLYQDFLDDELVLIVLLASIFTYFLRIPVLLPIIAVMVFVMVLYSLGVIFAYRFFTKREFKRVIDRN